MQPILKIRFLFFVFFLSHNEIFVLSAATISLVLGMEKFTKISLGLPVAHTKEITGTINTYVGYINLPDPEPNVMWVKFYANIQ